MHNRSRRWFLGLGAAWSAAVVACRSKSAGLPPAEPRALGAAVSSYGSRSPFEKTARFFNQNTKVPLQEASSRTPLHDTYGIITPSSLHFERHHSGVPAIDPATHPGTLTSDEVYGATAYILFMNGIVGENDVLDQTTLARVKMPSRNGFTSDPRPDVPVRKK